MSVIELTSREELDSFLEKNESVVIDFWAPWCGPCRALAPIFKEVSEQVKGIAFGKLDIESVDVSSKFGIQSIPCLIVFKGGQEAGRILGLQSKDVLKSKLDKYL